MGRHLQVGPSQFSALQYLCWHLVTARCCWDTDSGCVMAKSSISLEAYLDEDKVFKLTRIISSSESHNFESLRTTLGLRSPCSRSLLERFDVWKRAMLNRSQSSSSPSISCDLSYGERPYRCVVHHICISEYSDIFLLRNVEIEAWVCEAFYFLQLARAERRLRLHSKNRNSSCSFIPLI